MGALRLVPALVLATISVGCGSSGTCKDGTVQVGGTCYAHDPSDVTPPVVTVDPPVHARAVGDVRLTTDEHATIFYTTDGTQPTKLSLNEADNVLLPGLPDDAVVSFFAVDVNGNASAVQTVKWDVDRMGPGAPAPMALTLNGDTRTLTWTSPGDPQLGGVLIARVEGAIAASPESGKRYYPGSALGPGTTVVAAVAPGFTNAFTESHASTPGVVRYLAWSYDDVYNYGPAAGAFQKTDIGAQTGSLSVNAGTGVVTPTQPSHVTFAGSAELVGATLTVTLDVTNATSRVLFAPKLLLTNMLAPQTFGNSDGDFDTLGTVDTSDDVPYRSLGMAISPGGKVTTTLEIGNVTNTDVITLALDVRDNSVLVAGHWDDTVGSVVDEAANSEVGTLVGATAFRSNFEAHGGGVTPDGRWITGSRNSSVIGSYDLATGVRVMSRTLAGGKSYIRRLTLDPSGSSGYALLGAGHAYAFREGTGGTPTTLVTFDAATLREGGRLDIGPSRNRSLVLSPDGRWLAIATAEPGNGVIIVELATLRVAHRLVDEATATGVAFSADSASLVVAGPSWMNVYNVSDAALTKSVAMPGALPKTFDCLFGPDGRVWLGRENDLVAADLATGAVEVFDEDSALIATSGGKIYVEESGSSSVRRLDTAGVFEATLSFDTSIYSHSIQRSPF